MSFKTLMVHVDVDGELAARVKIAAELADRFCASLIGIAGWAPASVFLAEDAISGSAATQSPLQDMKSVLDEKGRQFLAAVRTSGRQVEWRSDLDFPIEIIAREARAADLIIVGNTQVSRDPFRALDPGGLLLKAGRPVLVVPTSASSFSPKRVAIAWIDVREARRAVLDALPFLKTAESVMVVEVVGDDTSASAWHRVKDVSHYLARHGIKVVSERVLPAELSTSKSLLQFVGSENIDLIVAGAYGHSRLGEWAFGGVTRELLADTPICCLYSN